MKIRRERVVLRWNKGKMPCIKVFILDKGVLGLK